MKKFTLFVLVLFFLSACGTGPSASPVEYVAMADLPLPIETPYIYEEEPEPSYAYEYTEEEYEEKYEPIYPYEETDPIFPNEIGEIMVLVYHGLVQENPSAYDRTIEGFWEDLQRLYDMGYRLICLRDLMRNHITTPAGYTPVVITFDDGRSSAFSLTEQEDGTLTAAPDTAVYILNAFYEKNPGFGRAGTFFINRVPEPFPGAGTFAERLQYLLSLGFDLGNHGYTHANFALLGRARLQREIGLMDQFIRCHAPGFEPISLAYPFGIRPPAALHSLATEGEYNGIPYRYHWAFRVGNTGVPAVPNHIRFDPMNITRIIGADASTPYTVIEDLGFWLQYYERYPHLRFISDGSPYTLTVPESRLPWVNQESLGDLELVVYSIDAEEPEISY